MCTLHVLCPTVCITGLHVKVLCMSILVLFFFFNIDLLGNVNSLQILNDCDSFFFFFFWNPK